MEATKPDGGHTRVWQHGLTRRLPRISGRRRLRGQDDGIGLVLMNGRLGGLFSGPGQIEELFNLFNPFGLLGDGGGVFGNPGLKLGSLFFKRNAAFGDLDVQAFQF